MISIIVCSVDESWRKQLKNNIIENIGCDFEFLFIDNKLEKKGICEAYNILAKQAKGEYLCFVHEDVLIETKNWGMELMTKASDPTVGVIGFAGSGTIAGFPYWEDRFTHFKYYVQRLKDGRLWSDETLTPKTAKYTKTVVLDGMFLFCRREVWEKQPFDKNTFANYHIYDMDFTFASAQYYSNYVCNCVVIHHFSLGCLDQKYFDELLLFYNKWKAKLPYTAYPEILSEKKKKYYYFGIKGTVKDMIKRSGLPSSYIYKFLKDINALNFYSDYLTMIQYIIKGRLRKKSTPNGY